jgi:hypothetical protein
MSHVRERQGECVLCTRGLGTYTPNTFLAHVVHCRIQFSTCKLPCIGTVHELNIQYCTARESLGTNMILTLDFVKDKLFKEFKSSEVFNGEK